MLTPRPVHRGSRPVSTSTQRRAAEARMMTTQTIMMTVQIEST